MKRSHTTAFHDQDIGLVLLAIAQHVPHVPAVVPVAARLRTLSCWFRANAPMWPAVTGSYSTGMQLAFGECATHEHMPVVRWFTAMDNRHFPQQQAVNYFAARGANDILMLLLQACPHRQGCSSSITEAAMAGNWETARLLRKHGVWVESCIGEIAAIQGRLDMVKWSIRESGYWTPAVTDAAAEFARMDVLEWLTEAGYPRHSSAYFGAVRRGNFDMVDWLLDHDYPLTSTVWHYAMRNDGCGGDNVADLEKLASRSCPWDEQTCAVAVLKGDFAALKWLREHHCPWDFHTIHHATRTGNFDIFQWAIANGCPHEKRDAVEWAMESQNMPMRNWAINNGLTMTWDYIPYMPKRKAPDE